MENYNLNNNKLFHCNTSDNLLNKNIDFHLDRNIQKPKEEKHKFKKYKNNTICSLHEVEYFLNNLDKAFKCVRVYKFLK